MKHYILSIFFVAFICVTSCAFGQSTSDSSKASKFVYCTIVGTQKFLSTKVTISIDYGQERGFFQDTRLRDEETGKLQTFNSMIDALNYMGNNGWEFVQAYIVTYGSQNVYNYLLKKAKE